VVIRGTCVPCVLQEPRQTISTIPSKAVQGKVFSNAPIACLRLRDGVWIRSRAWARCPAGPRRSGRRCPSGHGASCSADGASCRADGASPDAGPPADATDAAAADAGTTADATDAGASPDAADAAAEHGWHAGAAAKFSAAEHGRHAEHVEAVAADCRCTADAADAATAGYDRTSSRPRHDAAGRNARDGFWAWFWAGGRWHESTGRAARQSWRNEPTQPTAGRRAGRRSERRPRRSQPTGRPWRRRSEPAGRRICQSAHGGVSPAWPAARRRGRAWSASRWHRSRRRSDVARHGRYRRRSAQPWRNDEAFSAAWARRWRARRRWRLEWRRRESPDDVARPDWRQPSDNLARSDRRRWA